MIVKRNFVVKNFKFIKIVLFISIFLNSMMPKLCAFSIVEDTFEDFSRGKLDASGQNIYISRDGKIRTINRFDINDDGYLDLFFGNTHDLNFLPAQTICKIDKKRKIYQNDLPVLGGKRVKVADLNNDGNSDLIFLVHNDGLQGGRRFINIIYGNNGHWTARRSTGHLPAILPLDIAILDLNCDGWLDIAVLNKQGWVNKVPEDKNIRIYIGSEKGFLVSNYIDIGMPNAKYLEAVDFNRDGHKDLVAMDNNGELCFFWSNSSSEADAGFQQSKYKLPTNDCLCIVAADYTDDGLSGLLIGTESENIYLVEKTDSKNIFSLKTFQGFPASHISYGDIDGDGFRDILLTKLFENVSFGMGEATGADENTKSSTYILWGSSDGYDVKKSTELKARFASATAIGDIDGDGKMDIVSAIFQGDKSFQSKSLIYYGLGNRKFALSENMIKTSGATDVSIVSYEDSNDRNIVFCNSVDGTLYEQIPVYFYLGGLNGFSVDNRLEIPAQSGHEASAADLNADGFTDLVIPFTAHAGKAALKNPLLGINIFWGSQKGYDFENSRTILPGSYFNTSSIADMNRDGFLDIILGGWKKPDQLAIFYGSKNGFDPNNKTVINYSDRGRLQGALVADFNKDSWLDIACTSLGDDRLYILWGGPKGFDSENNQILQIAAPLALQTADFNSDGFLDIVCSSYYDKANGVFDMGNLIFWGSESGFSNSDTQWLPGYCTSFQAVADFDNDGFLDLFLPNYHGQVRRDSLPCPIFWGSENGFMLDRKTILICDSASGAQAGDFNNDGKIDLAVSCHTSYGNHKINSKVFYNDGKRFINPKIQDLPTLGSHFMWNSDMGHIYNRKYIQEYESMIFKLDENAKAVSLTYEAEIPNNTELLFEIRSSDAKKDINSKPWQPVKNGCFKISNSDNYFQYRAILKSNNGDCYPILDKVEFLFNVLP